MIEWVITGIIVTMYWFFHSQSGIMYVLKSICGLLLRCKNHSWLIERHYRQADRLWMQYNQYQPTRFWNCSLRTGSKTERSKLSGSSMFWNCFICTGNKTRSLLQVSLQRFWNCSLCTGSKTIQFLRQDENSFWNFCTGNKTFVRVSFQNPQFLCTGNKT